MDSVLRSHRRTSCGRSWAFSSARSWAWLPGIGPVLTVALLLPVTYSLDSIPAFIMFAGIYYGGMYGGSTTSILLNTPGESASIITALEGNRMALKGRGATALAAAAIGFVRGRDAGHHGADDCCPGDGENCTEVRTG